MKTKYLYSIHPSFSSRQKQEALRLVVTVILWFPENLPSRGGIFFETRFNAGSNNYVLESKRIKNLF